MLVLRCTPITWTLSSDCWKLLSTGMRRGWVSVLPLLLWLAGDAGTHASKASEHCRTAGWSGVSLGTSTSVVTLTAGEQSLPTALLSRKRMPCAHVKHAMRRQWQPPGRRGARRSGRHAFFRGQLQGLKAQAGADHAGCRPGAVAPHSHLPVCPGERAVGGGAEGEEPVLGLETLLVFELLLEAVKRVLFSQDLQGHVRARSAGDRRKGEAIYGVPARRAGTRNRGHL